MSSVNNKNYVGYLKFKCFGIVSNKSERQIKFILFDQII